MAQQRAVARLQASNIVVGGQALAWEQDEAWAAASAPGLAVALLVVASALGQVAAPVAAWAAVPALGQRMAEVLAEGQRRAEGLARASPAARQQAVESAQHVQAADTILPSARELLAALGLQPLPAKVRVLLVADTLVEEPEHTHLVSVGE